MLIVGMGSKYVNLLYQSRVSWQTTIDTCDNVMAKMGAAGELWLLDVKFVVQFGMHV